LRIITTVQISNMFRPYSAIIRLTKTVVLVKVNSVVFTYGIPWFTL